MQPAIAPNESAPETEELAKFREEWRQELARRKEEVDSPLRKGKKAELAVTAEGPSRTYKLPPRTAQNTGASTSAAPHPAIRDGKLAKSSAASAGLQGALNIYREAAQLEAKGELDAALGRYRQAFRLDPHVDRAYHREELLLSKLQNYKEKTNQTQDVEKVTSDLQKLTLKAAPEAKYISKSLAAVIDNFPAEVKFEQENELAPMHINILPVEMLYHVIRFLDVLSLERFARVCRRTRVLTLDPVYWSNLVTRTYKPPQISKIDDLVSVVEKFEADFRRVFIEHPRIRMDGIYIATCHYIRPGLSEDAWMNVNHLITYHRYLRFYPNGQVLHLLANEEVSPKDVVTLLKPTLRMKGFSIGNWYLEGTTLNIVNLLDASGHYSLPEWSLSEAQVTAMYRPHLISTPEGGSGTVTPITGQGSSLPSAAAGGQAASAVDGLAQARYIFDMTLEVKSRPLGRWNKLEILTYDSIQLETGDVSPFPLKNERPFWFSKVKSYGAL